MNQLYHYKCNNNWYRVILLYNQIIITTIYINFVYLYWLSLFHDLLLSYALWQKCFLQSRADAIVGCTGSSLLLRLFQKCLGTSLYSFIPWLAIVLLKLCRKNIFWAVLQWLPVTFCWWRIGKCNSVSIIVL